jgi:hypothetical protein
MIQSLGVCRRGVGITSQAQVKTMIDMEMLGLVPKKKYHLEYLCAWWDNGHHSHVVMFHRLASLSHL